jgi:polyisoprenoid-binding protein YceI
MMIFFGTEIFPISTLVITNVEKIDEQNFKLIADLTIKENTHPIEFIANIIYNDNTGLASGKLEIDRSKYNVKYRSKSWYPDIGDRFINDNFELFFNLLAKSKS